MIIAKAILPGDLAGTVDRLMPEIDVTELKAMGRKIRPYNDPSWKKLIDSVVYDGNMAKFW